MEFWYFQEEYSDSPPAQTPQNQSPPQERTNPVDSPESKPLSEEEESDSYWLVAVMAVFYLTCLSSSYISMHLILQLVGGGFGGTLPLFGKSLPLVEIVSMLGTGISEGATLGDAIISRQEKRIAPGKKVIFHLARAASFAGQSLLYYMALGQLFFAPSSMNSLESSKQQALLLEPPTAMHGAVVGVLSVSWSFGTNYVVPDALLLSLAAARRGRKRQKGLIERLLLAKSRTQSDRAPAPAETDERSRSPDRTSSPVPEPFKAACLKWPNFRQIGDRDRKGILLGFFAAGLFSLLSARPIEQPLWWRSLRFSLLLSGSAAGITLLYEYRTPSRLEREWKELEARRERLETESALQQREASNFATEQLQAIARQREALEQERLEFEADMRKRSEHLEARAQQQLQESDRQRKELEEQRELLFRQADNERQQLEKERTNLAAESQALEERLQRWADEQLANWQQQYAEMQQQYDAIIADLQQQLAAASAPKIAIGERDIDRRCNRVLATLWANNIPCELDRQPSDEFFPLEVYILILKDSRSLSKILSDNIAEQLEMVIGSGSIQIEKTPKVGLIRIAYDPQAQSRLERKKKIEIARSEKQQKIEAQLCTVEQLIPKGLGFLVTGQSSSAKTATACYIAQTLARQEGGAEILVLDIHAGDNSQKYWTPYRYQTVISAPLDCVWALWQIFFEYARRSKGIRETKRRLIVLIDEYEEWLGQVELILSLNRVKPQKIHFILDICSTIVKTFATGGRKFRVTPILINQSFNCKALRLDKNHARSFSQIHLNDNAEEFLDRTGAWTAELEEFFKVERANKYRGLAAGTVKATPFKHPTHWHCEQVSNLQPPVGLFDPPQLPLSIDLRYPENIIEALVEFDGLDEIAAEMAKSQSPKKSLPFPAPNRSETLPASAPSTEIAPDGTDWVQWLERCMDKSSQPAREAASSLGEPGAEGDSVQPCNSVQPVQFVPPSSPCDPLNAEISQVEKDWVVWLWKQNIRAQDQVLPTVWGVPRGRGKASLAAIEKLKVIQNELK